MVEFDEPRAPSICLSNFIQAQLIYVNTALEELGNIYSFLVLVNFEYNFRSADANSLHLLYFHLDILFDVNQLYLQRNFQELRWKLYLHLIRVRIIFNERLHERGFGQESQTVAKVALSKRQVVVRMDARYLFVDMPDRKLYDSFIVELNVLQDIWKELV